MVVIENSAYFWKTFNPYLNRIEFKLGPALMNFVKILAVFLLILSTGFQFLDLGQHFQKPAIEFDLADFGEKDSKEGKEEKSEQDGEDKILSFGNNFKLALIYWDLDWLKENSNYESPPKSLVTPPPDLS